MNPIVSGPEDMASHRDRETSPHMADFGENDDEDEDEDEELEEEDEKVRVTPPFTCHENLRSSTTVSIFAMIEKYLISFVSYFWFGLFIHC